MAAAILPAGASRRLGQRSRDAADHFGVNFAKLCIAPAAAPHTFRTGLVFGRIPTVDCHHYASGGAAAVM
jgi:hypothetical protein